MSLWLGILGMLVGCLIFFLFIPIKSTPESVHAPLQRSAIASPRPWYFWASFAAVVVVSLLVYRFLGAQDELVLRDKMAELVEVSKNQPELAESKARELIDHLESATQKYPDKPDYWFFAREPELFAEGVPSRSRCLCGCLSSGARRDQFIGKTG